MERSYAETLCLVHVLYREVIGFFIAISGRWFWTEGVCFGDRKWREEGRMKFFFFLGESRLGLYAETRNIVFKTSKEIKFK